MLNCYTKGVMICYIYKKLVCVHGFVTIHKDHVYVKMQRNESTSNDGKGRMESIPTSQQKEDQSSSKQLQCDTCVDG